MSSPFYRNPSADLFLDEKQITPEMFENCAVLHFCSVDLVDYPVRGAHRRAIELQSRPEPSFPSTRTSACRSGAVRRTVRRRYGSSCPVRIWSS
ncbi:MAG: hypothetical protein ACLR4Z_03770 [Butyricicoccaceae bacterium]